jgi:hypothetical protein
MADNGKKEFPINGLEEDVTSKKTRTIYAYIQNTKKLTKFVKRQMNKRFRKRYKK